MLVSVIVPCYNQGAYLDDALESVFNQTYILWQCIIVDDGSTDDTKYIAQKWVDKDSRFIYKYKNNGGLSSARNFGLFFSKGDFIQFLDADDVIKSDKFKIQIHSILNNPASDIAVSDYMASDEFDLSKPFGNDRYRTPFFAEHDSLGCIIRDWEVTLSIPCHCFLFRSNYFLEYKIKFDEMLPNHEDWDCWMSVFSMKPNVVLNDEKLAVYRIRHSAMCYDANRMKLGFLYALKKQIKLFDKKSKHYLLLKKKYYLVLTDYKCDNIYDKYILDLKINYKRFRKILKSKIQKLSFK